MLVHERAHAGAELERLFGRAEIRDRHRVSIARDEARLLHGVCPAGNQPARADRARAGGRAARVRLRVGGRSLGNGLRDRPLLARRDHGEDQARLRDHADSRPLAREHRDDRGDARPPLRRALPARPRDVRAAGRRGLARRALGQAAPEDARVRRDRPHSAPPRPRRVPRRALRHPALERDRAREAVEAHGTPAPRGRPDLPRGDGAEGGRAGARDRRRLAPALLVAGEGARYLGPGDRRRARGVRHRADRARDPHRRRRGRPRVPEAVLRALHRRHGRAREELLQRPLRALRLRGRRARDPGSLPRREQARRGRCRT